MEIDPDAPRPIYLQLADLIEGMIERGELQPNRPLPAERRLAEEYGVAYLSVRRAMRELRERGLVITWPGKGTFVAERH